MRYIRYALALLLVLICLIEAAAVAEDTETALDRAFASGMITFTETEIDLGLDEAEIIVPEQYGQMSDDLTWNEVLRDRVNRYPPEVVNEYLHETMMDSSEEEFIVSDIAPDGTKLFIGGVAALRKGRFVLFCPGSERAGQIWKPGKLYKYAGLSTDQAGRRKVVARRAVFRGFGQLRKAGRH